VLSLELRAGFDTRDVQVGKTAIRLRITTRLFLDVSF
jgi:hypothetical protein